METVAVSDYAAHRELVTGNLSFRAFGPRNFMKAQCSDGTLPSTKPFVLSSAVIANIVLSSLGTGTFPVSAFRT
jgi:hypothetical protein